MSFNLVHMSVFLFVLFCQKEVIHVFLYQCYSFSSSLDSKDDTLLEKLQAQILKNIQVSFISNKKFTNDLK